MGWLYSCWLGVGGLIAGAWLVRHWAIGYARERRFALSSGGCPHRRGPGTDDRAGDSAALTAGGDRFLTGAALSERDRFLTGAALSAGWPMLSVIVPAKDEEANIRACIASLLDQDYPELEVIVVDDRSADATGRIVRELGETHARGGDLRLVRVESLPEGWFGKHHAMRVGIETARGAMLCFIDADCRQTSRCTLWTAVAHAMERDGRPRGGVDFLTIIPRLEMASWWDRVVQPLCAAQLIAWFLPHKVNKRRTQVAYANGMFMLIRRACYEGIGGIDAARDHVNEDIRLAQLTKAHGFRLRVVENDDLYVSRMYRTPGETMRGWARIFHGSLQSRWKVGLSLASWAGLVILPWVSFLAAAGGCLMGRSDWVSAVVVWGVAVVLAQIAAVRVYRLFHAPRVCALAQPLSACVMVGILFSALMKSLGLSRTTWRGTTYPRSAAGTQAEGARPAARSPATARAIPSAGETATGPAEVSS